MDKFFEIEGWSWNINDRHWSSFLQFFGDHIPFGRPHDLTQLGFRPRFNGWESDQIHHDQKSQRCGPGSTTELKSPMIFVMKSLSWCFDSGLRQVDSKVAMLKHWPQISQLAQVLIFDSSISIFPHWRDMQSVHKSEIHEGFLLFPWCVSQETTWVGTFIRDLFGKFHRASSQGTWMITLDGIATRWGRARVSRVSRVTKNASKFTRTLHFAYRLPLCSHKQWIRLQVVGCCDYSLSCATENRFVETHGIRGLRAKDEPLKAPLCPHSEEAIRHWMVCLPSTDSILDNQNGPMLRIIGVDSHADCSNITEAWMDRWILRSRRVEKGRVGHHRCQVKTIWCRYDLADSCSQTMGHYRGACGEMVGNGWNVTWPHLAIQNNYCIFMAASLRPQAARRGNGRMFNRWSLRWDVLSWERFFLTGQVLRDLRLYDML